MFSYLHQKYLVQRGRFRGRREEKIYNQGNKKKKRRNSFFYSLNSLDKVDSSEGDKKKFNRRKMREKNSFLSSLKSSGVGCSIFAE